MGVRERVLILGSTGLLGQSLLREAEKRSVDYLGVSRTTSPHSVDVSDAAVLESLIAWYKPTVVINTVALVSLDICEDNPAVAEKINAEPSAVLASLARRYGFYFMQVSTDHYYQGDGTRLHVEDEPVVLVNEYARTKYLAEQLALSSEDACVLRTNIVGFRKRAGQPTFVETVIENCRFGKPLTLFSDYYTSSIDVTSFSRVVFDLMLKHPLGVLNVASREVASKQCFIERLALKLGLSLECAEVGSVFAMKSRVKRAESLGLDVTKAERLLGYPLPTLDNVIEQLAVEHEALNPALPQGSK